VIFDLDDTLIDQKAAAEPAVIAWAEELGIDSTGIIARWSALQHRHYARYQRREISFQGQRRERVRDLLGRALDDAEADALFEGYLSRYEAGWTVFVDAIACLERARDAGLKIAVLTNGERSQQMEKITRLGLTGLLDEVVCSSDLPAGKPDPRAFEATLELLGIDADVLGARNAGLSAFLVDRTSTSIKERTIRSLDELVFEPL
jgi:putative hydrolase of the HAD superfamily